LLGGFVRTLNRLNERHDLDTICRDEAGEAFLALASDAGVDEPQASAWFDQWRDF
jgi:hypothetical protein